MVSILIGGIGSFWLIFGGYYFAIQEPSLVRFMLCAFLGLPSLALVLALAHASYAARRIRVQFRVRKFQGETRGESNGD
jgi:uncharacterized membrane protein